MKYNGPCADTAGSAGEGLRKKVQLRNVNR